MIYLRICLLAVCGAVFMTANAQQHDDHDHLIEQPMPEFPMGELVRGREGWVLVKFTVLQDGTVFSPIIEESSGSEAFDNAAIAAVSEWRYIPGTQQSESALRDYALLTETGPGREMAGNLEEPIRAIEAFVEDEGEALPPYMAANTEVLIRHEGRRAGGPRAEQRPSSANEPPPRPAAEPTTPNR